jgi:hypothetical protein
MLQTLQEATMPLQQRIVIIGVAVVITLTIFEMVRKRRLREEYSWLWMVAGGGIAVAALTPFEVLRLLAQSMGSENPPAAIFFLGFICMLFLCLQFSVRLSRMTEQIKNLGQEVALLENALERESSKGEE